MVAMSKADLTCVPSDAGDTHMRIPMCLCTHAHAHQKNATKANSALPICIGDNRRRQKKFLSKNHPMHTTERKCREGVQLGQKFGQDADKKKKRIKFKPSEQNCSGQY